MTLLAIFFTEIWRITQNGDETYKHQSWASFDVLTRPVTHSTNKPKTLSHAHTNYTSTWIRKNICSKLFKHRLFVVRFVGQNHFIIISLNTGYSKMYCYSCPRSGPLLKRVCWWKLCIWSPFRTMTGNLVLRIHIYCISFSDAQGKCYVSWYGYGTGKRALSCYLI